MKKIERLNPFTIIQTDSDYLTGAHWNEMADRVERVEAWIADKEREADLRKQLERIAGK